MFGNTNKKLEEAFSEKLTVSNPVEAVVSATYSLTCYNCEATMKFTDSDTHTTCDIINGQYTEAIAINCTACGLENLIR